MLDHTEPLSFAAGQLYTTLSVADAAAATAFIAGAEPRAVRQRYEQAITDAAVAVTRASSGLTDETMMRAAGPDQRPTRRLHRSGRDRADEQSRGQSRGLVIPVGGVVADAAEILPDAQRLYQRDVGAGGRRDHRVHPDSRRR